MSDFKKCITNAVNNNDISKDQEMKFQEYMMIIKNKLN